MLTLYTAIGLLRLQKDSEHSYPIIVNNHQEHALDQSEMLLWSSLTFQFLTFQEAKQCFEQQLQKHLITSNYTFDHYIRRLLFRGLIVKGDGLASIDALYDLLGNLYIVPLAGAFHVRLFSSLHLLLQGKLAFSQLKKALVQEPAHSPVEKLILSYAKERSLSTSELLYFFDSDKIVNIKQYVSNLKKGDMTCDELKQHTHTQYAQTPVLIAIGNLYLQKQIIFKTL